MSITWFTQSSRETTVRQKRYARKTIDGESRVEQKHTTKELIRKNTRRTGGGVDDGQGHGVGDGLDVLNVQEGLNAAAGLAHLGVVAADGGLHGGGHTAGGAEGLQVGVVVCRGREQRIKLVQIDLRKWRTGATYSTGTGTQRRTWSCRERRKSCSRSCTQS
jgi:hypothetical protein